MTTKTPKWRVMKMRGMWVVRNPSGAHFGAYFTWLEAIAQVTARKTHLRPGGGGQFDRRGSYDHDERVWGQAFGFSGPIRCDTRTEHDHKNNT